MFPFCMIFIAFTVRNSLLFDLLKAIDKETKEVPDENIVRHFNIYLLLFLGKAMRDPEFVSLGGTYGQDFAFL